MKLEDRMRRSVKQRKDLVFLRSDFAKMGGYSQVGKALARLVEEETLVRVSKGAYAKTRINKFTGKPAAAGTLERVAEELFRKLNIWIGPSFLVEEYNSGRSTQIPMGLIANTGSRRVTRRVTVGASTLQYENSWGKAQLRALLMRG